MNLYFIAIAPDEKLSEKIRSVQKDFAERFHSKKSYLNFPHITIIPPFQFSENVEHQLVEQFKNINIQTSSFVLSLNNFACFPNPKHPVIFIQPEDSDSLKMLYSEIVNGLWLNINNRFHPHLTVAYRDLTFDHFGKAWEEYKNKEFKAEFPVKTIGLYKHFNGKWNLIAQQNLA